MAKEDGEKEKEEGRQEQEKKWEEERKMEDRDGGELCGEKCVRDSG